MKSLAEIQKAELEKGNEEEATQHAGPKPITIHLRGVREKLTDKYWAPTTTTTISIPAVPNDTTRCPEETLLNIHIALGDSDPVALYNPSSTKLFYLYSFTGEENYKNMTLADVNRLGEEGSVWYVVYEKVLYSPFGFYIPIFWEPEPYRGIPKSLRMVFEARIRTKIGTKKKAPVLMITNLKDGHFLPTWESVSKFYRENPEYLLFYKGYSEESNLVPTLVDPR
ncbi:hypothetical protein TWF281_000162 [Arthrobotrys megalospora]